MHLYDSGEVNWQLPDGTPVQLHTVTNYPWDGQIEIEVDVAETAEFSLFLRIPGWCQEAHLRVGGTDIVEKVEAGKYFEVRRVWDSGITRVELELSMLPEFITANPMLMEARGAVAIKRGPIVYCLESVDNPGFSVRNAQIITDECLQTEYHSELLGGVVLIKGNGLAPVREWGGLYRVRSQAWEEQSRSVSLIAVPYYTWANRGISEMTIWIRTDSN